MKLDDTAKIITIVSAVVGMMITGAVFFGNQKLQSLQSSLNTLTIAKQTVEVNRTEYDNSARLIVNFEFPLARTFAVQYSSDRKVIGRNFMMATDQLGQDFALSIPDWIDRKGLMTGNSCTNTGLIARQAVTLVVKNVGFPDATNIVIKAKQKKSNLGPRLAWTEKKVPSGDLSYGELLAVTDQWEDVDIRLPSLRGLNVPPEDRIPVQVVLASVSGRSLFGTILVPMTISWTDNLGNQGKQSQTFDIMRENAPFVQSSLTGAEIGNPTCPSR